MRSDMQKIIVERPRLGSRLPSPKTAKRLDPLRVLDEDFDSGPRRAAAARHEKSFNEHLQPLWRFLRSNRGRPWSKVYSEIRARLDGRGVLGRHLLDHLDWEVSTHCLLAGKQVLARSPWGGRTLPVEGFYVHPKTGILREAPRRRYVPRSQRPREVIRVERADGRLFERIDGLWFETAYAADSSGDPVQVLKRQCPSKRVREIDEWIRQAERGRRGYKRGADWVRVPRRTCG